MKHVRNLKMSVAILASHRLRTALSISGVVLGVAAMIIIMSIGDGMSNEIKEVFRSMGTDMLVVRAGKFRQFRGHAHQTALVTTLTEKDTAALGKGSDLLALAGSAISRSMVVKYRSISSKTTVEGVSEEVFAIRNITPEKGRLLKGNEMGARRNLAVLGATAAANLFEDDDPIGSYIIIGRLPFQVVGVAAAKGSDIQGNDQDDVIFIPLDTGMRRLFHTKWIETIYLRSRDENTLDELAEAATGIIRKQHRIKDAGNDDFTIMNQKEILDASISTTESTTRLVAGVAGISLVVAGIGILAVMLMSVKERQWEIGLRRAVGARRGDILVQFLTEASLLSLAGGLLGVLTGLIGIFLCNHYNWIRADFSVDAAIMSSLVSILTGIIFGIHPARKASRLEPIMALNAPR